MVSDAVLKACRDCPRLADFRDQTKRRFPDYLCLPVPPVGPASAAILIVGLAPGLHGANATGRPFTGDFAGLLLYKTLHRLGLTNQAQSQSATDGLVLKNCRITNAVKCVPPANRPSGAEIRACAPYLVAELASLPAHGVIIALGRIAHDAILRAFEEPLSRFPFSHGARHKLGTRILWDSYHCSRYNTQTRRLSEESFQAVIEAAVREVL